jgi:hypothetical protein
MALLIRLFICLTFSCYFSPSSYLISSFFFLAFPSFCFSSAFLSLFSTFSLIFSLSKNCKAIPVTGQEGPEGCETSRLPHFFRQAAHRWRWGCQPAALYLPGRVLVLISFRGWVDPRDLMRLEVLGHLTNAITSSGIEPATFRFVAYASTNYDTACPLVSFSSSL